MLAVISLAIGILALRANNEHMIALRDTVYAADKDNKDVETALKNLQHYVVTHMNTDLGGGKTGVYPPVQLKYTYDRLVQAESDALAKSNTDFYTQAQKYCEAQNPSGFFGATRIGCVQDYLTSHDTQHQIAPIPDALYKFAFISPKWSPDLAGWSLVVTAFGAVLFAISLTVKRFFKHHA
jgi:hypothetical protein